MAIVIQLPDVASAGDFGLIALPSLSKCRAYHLLGGSQAESIANRVAADQPLTVAGLPIYEPDCAVLSSTAGFVRPVAGSQYDRTVVIVFADPYQAPASAPAEPTEAAMADSLPVVWWGGQYNGLFLFANVWKLRPRADGGTSDIDTSAYNGSADRPWFYPDGTMRKGGYRMAVIRQRAADATLWVQNGAILQLIGTVARNDVGGAPMASKFGGIGGTAASVLRVAAIAEFTALTDAEVAAVADFIAADVEARGIDFWGRSAG
ncbi:hypothetical protein [Sphingomonas sp. Leaf4]|uniref:hypothetical protein n=1 Tax=Sphingomonas sp. Leaf4 TaxID=2876553 RepID=UPI001E50EBA0|nr:hypothetical protein [Sphingomonas sp. Leaf4]